MARRVFVLRLLPVFLIWGVCACKSMAITMFIHPSDDSYVNISTPGSNYGSENKIRVGRNGDLLYRTYLKFDFSSLPAGTSIISAELRLHCNLATIPRPNVSVHYLEDDSWNEGTITWNNAPATFRTAASDTVAVTLDDNYWTITEDVNAAYNGDGIISLVLKIPDESIADFSYFYFYAKEELVASDGWPCIEVEYAGTKYGGGSGTSQDPFLVYTAEQLNQIGDNPEDWDKHFRLMADINLAGFTGTEFNLISSDWTEPFTGVFDGNGHVISNFSFSTPAFFNDAGLFGALGIGGQIKDLGVADCNIYVGTSSATGPLVGVLDGGAISSCWSQGGRVSGDFRAGGLVGQVYTGCLADSYAEGLNVFARNNYVGGLVGDNSAEIRNCYSTCYVSGSLGPLGGLVARNTGSVVDSFWDMETSGQTWSAGGTGKTTAEMKSLPTFAIWLCSGSGDLWVIDDGVDYPRLAWEGSGGRLLSSFHYPGSGTKADPYLISTREQLNLIGLLSCEWDKHFRLVADVNLAGYTGTQFNLISTDWAQPFTGVFDGDGHEISSLTYSNSTGFVNYAGLFGCLGTNGQIRNLGLKNCSLSVSISNGAGSLAGLLYGGTITNCRSRGGQVSGDFRTGGLVGEVATGILTDSYAEGLNVFGLSNYVGGLAGDNAAQIRRCFSTCSVNGSVGPLGGLVAHNSGSVVNSFWDKTTSGRTWSAGGTGKTTTEMKRLTTFTTAGWDFLGESTNGTDDVWRMCLDYVSYPRQWWEFADGDLVCPDGVSGKDLAVFCENWLEVCFSYREDFCDDNVIDFSDWAVFASAWASTPASPDWNPSCDAAPQGGDGIINGRDMAVFIRHWLQDGSYKLRTDMAPAGGDGTVDMMDFAALAENWLAGI